MVKVKNARVVLRHLKRAGQSFKELCVSWARHGGQTTVVSLQLAARKPPSGNDLRQSHHSRGRRGDQTKRRRKD